MKKDLKLVVVGDGSCGKTSLIVAHASGHFCEDYVPTAFNDYAVEAILNGKTKVVTVCDTAGEDDFSSMRPLSYPDADVFLLCYSIEQCDSLKRIRDKWIPEIRHFCPATPIIIVGNKKDIRDEEKQQCSMVPLEEAQDCAKQFSALPLIECSAKTRENVRTVFDSAIRAAAAYRNRRHNKVIQSIMKLRLVF